MPDRIQLRRTRGWRLPPNSMSVARPTMWGNPWEVIHIPDGWAASWQWGALGMGEPWHPADEQRFVQCSTRAEAHTAAVRLYRWYRQRRPLLDVTLLAGKNLACWCPPQYACHVDDLLEAANLAPTQPAPEE